MCGEVMHSKQVHVLIFIVILSLLLLSLPSYTKGVSVQTTSNYWVTVKPTTDSLLYTHVNRNWTLSFQALWSYGNNTGKPIGNATVEMQVSGAKEGVIATLQLNTTSGTFSFNYSSSTADKITFKPVVLTTQDGIQWKAVIVKNEGAQVYGLQSSSVTVWWDTFQVLLDNTDTSTLETSEVSVNVTYLLLPQQGLTLPAQDTYSNQTFLPKIVSRANVTINGVKAQETHIQGVYSADTSTLFPIEYVIVGVSQSGWTTTYNAFDFSQDANSAVWLQYLLIIILILVALFLAIYFLLFKKSAQGTSLLDRKRFPFIGGALMLLLSFFSLYWGSLAVEATLHGFGWLPLTIFGFSSFTIGLTSGVLSMAKKNQVLVLFMMCVPAIVNTVAVKFSFDAYSLPAPWLAIVLSLGISIASCILVSNADEYFSVSKSKGMTAVNK